MAAILVYLPHESEWDLALARARELAQRTGAPITLADVVPARASAGVERAAYERLETLARTLERAGLDVDVVPLRGRPAVELTRLAIDGGYGLVLKPARPDAPEGTAAFGTVARQLLRLCPVPVWIVRREPTRRPRVVLAAVDPAADADRGDDLGSEVLQHAHRIAWAEDAELHVVHAWRPHAEGTLGSPLWSSSTSERRVREAWAARHASARLLALCQRNEEIAATARIHFVKGDVPEAISEVASRIGAGVMVLGTVGRRGVAGFVLGNTAERVLRSTPTSLVAVKSPAFVSPLLEGGSTTAA